MQCDCGVTVSCAAASREPCQSVASCTTEQVEKITNFFASLAMRSTSETLARRVEQEVYLAIFVFLYHCRRKVIDVSLHAMHRAIPGIVARL